MRVRSNLHFGRHDRAMHRQRRDRSVAQAVHVDKAGAEYRGDDQGDRDQQG
jgi:hypothetical protein